MRRLAQHRAAFFDAGVAVAERRANLGQLEAAFGGDAAHAVERLVEVEPDIVGQRLERRDVEDRDFVAQGVGFGFGDQAVDRPHEGGQRLAAAGRRAKQDIVPGRTLRRADHGPSELLHVRGRAEAPLEPEADRGMKLAEDGHEWAYITGRATDGCGQIV